MSDIYEESIEFHKKYRGKIEIRCKFPVKSRKDLSLAYTPGVAAPCREIAKDKSKAYDYTLKNNSVAIVSDGSRVLGLGNLGPYGAIPVMEGKALLFKAFGDVDAYPICLATQDKDKIIEAVKQIAPVFGGINLEDIESPKCFEVEDALQDIGIPVMHDDQHGTAIVALAALINSLKVVGKRWQDVRVVVSGAGAAGLAITRLLISIGKIFPDMRLHEVLTCDVEGTIYRGRPILMDPWKEEVGDMTNPYKKKLTVKEALRGTDVFIGVSAPGVITAQDVQTMAKDPIILALANPIPEIMPDEAKKGGAAVIATGRSDFPNQVNNVLAFPGVFRGALDCRAVKITHKMKVAAALAISRCIKVPTAKSILPQATDKKVAKRVAKAVADAWEKEKPNSGE